jgi:hypothetical protein
MCGKPLPREQIMAHSLTARSCDETSTAAENLAY